MRRLRATAGRVRLQECVDSGVEILAGLQIQVAAESRSNEIVVMTYAAGQVNQAAPGPLATRCIAAMNSGRAASSLVSPAWHVARTVSR